MYNTPSYAVRSEGTICALPKAIYENVCVFFSLCLGVRFVLVEEKTYYSKTCEMQPSLQNEDIPFGPILLFLKVIYSLK
jgi:hypothetical protein